MINIINILYQGQYRFLNNLLSFFMDSAIMRAQLSFDQPPKKAEPT